MPADLQSIAAIAIVTITFMVICVRYLMKRRKVRNGTACAGGCGCTKSAPPDISPHS